MSQMKTMSFEKEVYKKYYALVYSTCRRTLLEGSLLEDAIQSTFLLYIKEENKIKSDLASWFYWSAKNVSIVINRDLLKQKQVKEFLKKEKSENESIQISLDQLIDSLPKNKKELLLFKFYEGKTYLEIANLFQSNESTIRSRINSIVELLRSKLKQKEVNLSLIIVALFNPENIPPLKIDPHNSTFILQNSVFQQSILKGVYKMYFIAKLKIASLIILIFVLGLGTYLQLRSETEIVQKQNEEIVKNKAKGEVAPQDEKVKLLEDVLLAFKTKWNARDNDGLLDLFHPESMLKKEFLADQDKKESLKTHFTNTENAFGNISTQEIFLVQKNRYSVKTEYSIKGAVYGTFEFQKANEKWLIFKFDIDEWDKDFNGILNLQTITANGIKGDFEQLKKLKTIINLGVEKLKANDLEGFFALFHSESKFLKQFYVKEKEKLKKEWGEVASNWGEMKVRIIGYDAKTNIFLLQLEFTKAGSYLLSIKLIKVGKNWQIEVLDSGN